MESLSDDVRRSIPPDDWTERKTIAARLCADNAGFWWVDYLPGAELSPALPDYWAELLTVPATHVSFTHVLRVGYSEEEPIPGFGPVAIVRWRFWRPKRRGYLQLTWDGDGRDLLDIRNVAQASAREIQGLATLANTIQRRGVGRRPGPNADFLAGLERLDAKHELKRRINAALDAFEQQGIPWNIDDLANAVKENTDPKTLRKWCRDTGLRLPRATGR